MKKFAEGCFAKMSVRITFQIRPRSTRPEYNLGENFPRVMGWDFYVNEDEDFPQLSEF